MKQRGCIVPVSSIILGLFLIWCSGAFAQQPFAGVAVNRATLNSSVSIVTGNTFQTVLASLVGVTTTPRQSLTIQNNNTNGDSCWLFLGSGTATKATSIILAQGQSYSRYFPYVPSDAIQATCATSADTLYVDNQ